MRNTAGADPRLTVSARVARARTLAQIAVVVLIVGVVTAVLYGMGLHPAHPRTTVVTGARSSGVPKRLLVFVKGGSADLRTYEPLLGKLRDEPALAGSDLLVFDHQLARLTIGHLSDYATRLRAEIDGQWIKAGGYDEVILAGHSMGSLLVRQAYLQSAGRDPRQPRTIPWSDRVSRIVLLAGIGRGVDQEEHGRWSWVLRSARFVPLLRNSVMYDVLRGADFVTNVRVGWIRHFAELDRAAAADERAPKPPVVVQIIGTEDDVLRRDDNIDLEQFSTAYHLEVPGAGHQTLHRLDLTPDPALSYAIFREAFTAGAPPHALPRRIQPDTVERVVFLLHGLRSSRDEWVRELAPMLRQRLPHAEVVESSYGWTTLLGFTLPAVRRRELRWLQDQYTEYLARHPKAVFDVAAHSFGAYLLGESLQRVPSMRFGRIVLLGSVLPAEYPWRQRHDWGQAEVVRTDRAAEDMVVAVFCSALHGIGMTDVGTSGWSGFEEHGELESDVVWHPGGHSAALEPTNMESLAEFIATGRVKPATVVVERPPRSVTIMSQLAPWLARLLLIGLVALLVHWLRRGRAPASRRIGVAMATVVVIAIVLDVL